MFYTADSLRQMHQGGETVDFLFFYGHQLPSDGSATESCLSQWYPCIFAFFTAFGILILRRSIFIDFLTFFRNNLHVLFSRILYHSEIFLTEHLGHIVTAHQCNHKCYGKYHCNIEKIAYHTHRVAIFSFSQQTPFHYSF